MLENKRQKQGTDASHETQFRASFRSTAAVEVSCRSLNFFGMTTKATLTYEDCYCAVNVHTILVQKLGSPLLLAVNTGYIACTKVLLPTKVSLSVKQVDNIQINQGNENTFACDLSEIANYIPASASSSAMKFAIISLCPESL